MAACCGESSTITLSNDGRLHYFGYNYVGQSGLGKDMLVIEVPSRIPNLQKIKQTGLLWFTFYCLC